MGQKSSRPVLEEGKAQRDIPSSDQINDSITAGTHLFIHLFDEILTFHYFNLQLWSNFE